VAAQPQLAVERLHCTLCLFRSLVLHQAPLLDEAALHGDLAVGWLGLRREGAPELGHVAVALGQSVHEETLRVQLPLVVAAIH